MPGTFVLCRFYMGDDFWVCLFRIPSQPFHAGNRGSNPLGDAKQNNDLSKPCILGTNSGDKNRLGNSSGGFFVLERDHFSGGVGAAEYLVVDIKVQKAQAAQVSFGGGGGFVAEDALDYGYGVSGFI